jgi:hypothetical protein
MVEVVMRMRLTSVECAMAHGVLAAKSSTGNLLLGQINSA